MVNIKIIKYKYQYNILLALCLSLTGCVIQNNTLGKIDTLQEDDVGYIAATLVSKQIANEKDLALPSPPFITAHFYGNSTSEQLNFDLNTYRSDSWKTPSIKNNFDLENKLTVLVPVKPGKYWLGNVQADYYGGYNIKTILKAPYPLIIVKRGEITYAGSIQVVAKVGRNIKGDARPGNIRLDIQDNFIDDIKFMNSIDPRIHSLPLHNGLK